MLGTRLLISGRGEREVAGLDDNTREEEEERATTPKPGASVPEPGHWGMHLWLYPSLCGEGWDASSGRVLAIEQILLLELLTASPPFRPAADACLQTTSSHPSAFSSLSGPPSLLPQLLFSP